MLDRDTTGNFFVTGRIQDAIATHTASDIVLSAMGRNAAVFGGVMDITDVFLKMMQVALGDAAIRQELINRFGNPGLIAFLRRPASAGLNRNLRQVPLTYVATTGNLY